jgi:hypothetical protein
MDIMSPEMAWTKYMREFGITPTTKCP